MLRDKISDTKKVFQIINHDLDRLNTAKQCEKEKIYQKLKLMNEELSDSVIELVKYVHLNKITKS